MIWDTYRYECGLKYIKIKIYFHHFLFFNLYNIWPQKSFAVLKDTSKYYGAVMCFWCVSDSHMFPIVDFRWVTISKTDGFFLITWNTWRTKSLFVFIHTFIYKITLCEMVNNHILIACVTKKAQNHIYNITISKVTYCLIE